MIDLWDRDWSEELIFKKEERLPELPEDLLFILCRKNPVLEDMIERFELQIDD